MVNKRIQLNRLTCIFFHALMKYLQIAFLDLPVVSEILISTLKYQSHGEKLSICKIIIVTRSV